MTRTNNEHDTERGPLVTLLTGTAVGGPDGFVICDSCNKGLTDQSHDGPSVHADTVHVYVTTVAPDVDRWTLRRINCEDCGPVGDGDADETGEAHVTASLTYDIRRACFALADVTVTAVERAASEEVA